MRPQLTPGPVETMEAGECPFSPSSSEESSLPWVLQRSGGELAFLCPPGSYKHQSDFKEGYGVGGSSFCVLLSLVE